MNVEIKIELEDPQSCRGCPLLVKDYVDDDYTEECVIGYIVTYDCFALKRPQKCINEYGE